jgi:hypothetical protein
VGCNELALTEVYRHCDSCSVGGFARNYFFELRGSKMH